MTRKRVLLEGDLDTSILEHNQVGIIGYGSQGRAQALNLRDGGFTPLVAVRRGRSFEKALADGFAPLEIEEAARRADIIMLLAPDEAQADLCHNRIIPHAKSHAFLGFAAGFSVHFGLIRFPNHIRVFLAAPKGPGSILRSRFEAGGGIPGLIASLNDDREEWLVAMAYAKAIGCARAGVIETTFREETLADLFGEQCVLSGGLVALMKAAFDVLVARGCTPEVAYIECIGEVEYMASLISRVGLARLEDYISSTAYYGGATRGSRVIDDGVRQRLAVIFDEIEQGKFLKEFQGYVASGKRGLAADSDLSILEAARSSLKAAS